LKPAGERAAARRLTRSGMIDLRELFFYVEIPVGNTGRVNRDAHDLARCINSEGIADRTSGLLHFDEIVLVSDAGLRVKGRARPMMPMGSKAAARKWREKVFAVEVVIAE